MSLAARSANRESPARVKLPMAPDAIAGLRCDSALINSGRSTWAAPEIAAALTVDTFYVGVEREGEDERGQVAIIVIIVISIK